MTIGAVVGIIVGGGWMWVDHVSDRGATGGKGVKIVMGAFMGRCGDGGRGVDGHLRDVLSAMSTVAKYSPSRRPRRSTSCRTR
ncbi:hypothetical protein GS854_00450 [Rhodococcus hoagii]|nr:hypothetical protein [Prescottella equi]